MRDNKTKQQAENAWWIEVNNKIWFSVSVFVHIAKFHW